MFLGANMTYLIPNPHQTIFETRVHHFSGRPTGPRLVESPTSRMVVAYAPWPEIQDLLANLGSIKLAAYLLAGAAWPEGIIARLYIGETVDVATRLKTHAADPRKGFVSDVFVIGSRDPNFDKADVQFLQYRLDRRVEELDRAYIIRGVRPTLPKVDPARFARSESDFTDIRRLLPSVGCNLLEARDCDAADDCVDQNEFVSTYADTREIERARPRSAAAPTWAQTRDRNDRSIPRANDRRPRVPNGMALESRPSLFVLNHAGLVAYGYQHDAEFVVLPGSQMRRASMRSFEDDAANQQRRKDIVDAQVVVKVKGAQDRWRLTRERRFPSRGIAAKVLMGVNLRNDAWVAVTADARTA
jgi:hypothetical protein